MKGEEKDMTTSSDDLDVIKKKKKRDGVTMSTLSQITSIYSGSESESDANKDEDSQKSLSKSHEDSPADYSFEVNEEEELMTIPQPKSNSNGNGNEKKGEGNQEEEDEEIEIDEDSEIMIMHVENTNNSQEDKKEETCVILEEEEEKCEDKDNITSNVHTNGKKEKVVKLKKQTKNLDSSNTLIEARELDGSDSSDKNFAIFAKEDIKKGSKIGIYDGQYVVFGTSNEQEAVYFARFDSLFGVNADKSDGIMKFIKHSKTPNAVWKKKEGSLPNQLWVMAGSKDIKKGDQITINYGKARPKQLETVSNNQHKESKKRKNKDTKDKNGNNDDGNNENITKKTKKSSGKRNNTKNE